MSVRSVVYVLAVLAIAGGGWWGYSCIRSAAPSNTFTDLISHYPPGSITYLASGRSYLVHRTGDDFIALSEAEPDMADRQAGCAIRYRADLQSGGTTGVFRDDCHGNLYTSDGQPIAAGQTPMQRHPVIAEQNKVQVRSDICLNGASNAPEACRL